MNLSGQQISHYEILEKLGSGGMGIVYKAKDLKLDRLVALKFLNKELITEEEFRQRFIHEAKAISALEHPNIAVVYEIDEVEDFIFISMGYYPGQTLQERISAGPLPLTEVYSIGLQVAKGLNLAHNSGIIHRDIKPGNVVITRGSQVKILDFGLAKMINLTGVTQQDTVIGTAAYMSPEQVQGKPVDHRTDIFSFGVMLYEMIAGVRPFRGEYSAAVVYSIMHEEPKPLHLIRPEIPRACEKLVNRALEKDLEKRYQSAREIETDLQNLINDMSAPVKPIKIKRSHLLQNRGAQVLVSLFIIALVVFTYFILSPTEVNSRKTSIAIMPIEIVKTKSEWAWIGGVINDLLYTDLSQDSSLRVLNAQQRQRIMRSLDIKNTDINKEEAARIAQKAQVEHFMLSNLSVLENNIQMNARIFETSSGALLSKLEPLQSTIPQLHELVDELSAHVVEVLNFKTPKEVVKGKVAALTTPSLDALRYFLEGKDAALDRRHQESILKLNKALKFDSTFIQAYYFLAWQYSEVGDDIMAMKILAKGKPFISNLSLEYRLEYLCEEAKYENRWQDYATYLKQLLRINPFDATVHYRYGWTLFNKFRQLDAGIAAMEKSLQLDPNYSWAINSLGYAYLQNNNKEKSIEMIEKYIALNPTDVNPLDSKAEILLYTGKYDEAIDLCDRILTLKPDFLSARIILARAFMAKGEYTRAQKTIEQYLRLTSNAYYRSIGQTLKAGIHLLRSELKEAVVSAERALAMDSSNVEAHWLRGRILLKTGDRDGFNNEFKTFELILNAEGGLDGRWLLYHLQGQKTLLDTNFGSAIEWFEKAIEYGPSDRSFYLSALANAYEQAGQLKQAVKYYHLAFAFNPNNALVSFGLGKTYEKLGDEASAKDAYEKVLEIWSGADKNIKEIEIIKRKLKQINIRSKS